MKSLLREKETKEEWRSVVGYDGLYEVSNMGNLRSLRRGIVKCLKPSKCAGEYRHVGLWKNKELKYHNVHRIVAIAFLKNEHDKKTVNHKNGDRHDNRSENLEWCTYKENTQHAALKGRLSCGEDRWNSKLTRRDVNIIREIIRNRPKNRRYKSSRQYSNNSIGKLFNVSASTISRVASAKGWKEHEYRLAEIGELPL